MPTSSIRLLLKPFNFFFWTGLWLFGLGLLFWYPMRWWPGDRFLLVQLLNYFTPWLLLGLIPALFCAGLARRKWLAVLLAAPTLLIGLTFAPLFLPRPSLVLAGSNSLKVMSYNLWWHNRNIEPAIEVIKQEQPDILLFQEAAPFFITSLKNKLANLYPDGEIYFSYDVNMQQAIISRFPITPLANSYEQGRVQKVIIDTPDGPIMVWNVHHFQPRNWQRQYKQFVNLAKAIAAVETPLIVGGDFNTTDQTQAYQLIEQQLANAHWQAGWGFGFTFPSHKVKIKDIRIPTPVIRIDHIFYSSHFLARRAYTVANSGGSDHFPVVADLSVIR